MLSSEIFIPLLQSAGSWSVQVGPWSLPPAAWMPATAVIGAWALRTRQRAMTMTMRDASGDDASGDA